MSPLYLVGGSVRDLMLGRAIKDFDLTVEGDAAQLAEATLRKYAGKVVFHSRFGTATWTLDATTFKRLDVPLVGASGFPPFLDFVSARNETYVQPGALPTVKRSSIDDDLRRRDFAMNAMALRLDGKYWGQLYDPLDGEADLQQKLVRILHPRSFVDDPTRMLRAVRYAERYGFAIEPETLALMNDEAKSILSRLSGERLRHEFDLMFEEPNVSSMLKRLAELNLLPSIHPSLRITNYDLRITEPASEFGAFTPPDILSFKQTLGWELWLMRLPVADIDEIAARLAFPMPLARAARAASQLFTEASSFVDWKPSQWTFHLDNLPKLSVYAVYLINNDLNLREYLVHWQNVKPTTNGDDLKGRGLEPGPRYAEILHQLRAAWLDGDVTTQAEEKSLLDKLLR
ncbi:MAG TPA: hypothetical protein VK327_06875 [Candidatus Paceibacterota bacterium]|nr:hypothetical protein [Candidatus Paceibacterota bacterium]